MAYAMQSYGTRRILAAFAVAGVLAGAQVAWARSSQPVEPDYTKGEKLDGKLNYQALGPTGTIGNIWATGLVKGTDKTRMIQIRSVDKGTPADGVLQEGDVILGVILPRVTPPPASLSSGPVTVRRDYFSWDARKALSAAITEAEKKRNGGKLVLNVWRKGNTSPVTITIPVMGTFSDTAPWECEKTTAIIDAACQAILKRGFYNKDRRGNMRRRSGIDARLEVLGLLATGEEKYLPIIRKYARDLGNPDVSLDPESPGKHSWNWSYTNILLTEYYLATKDEYVLPAIKEHAVKMALGASDVGTWSHGMAYYFTANGKRYKYPSAYGAMNQCSITCAMSLVLAQKCGVKDKEVDRVVGKATNFLRWYVDKGGIPYGDHEPVNNYHDDNGKNSQTAVLFDLVRDREATDYFTRMTLASYNDREVGHTGHFLGMNWGPPAAAIAGDEAAQSFVRNTRWFTELERRPGGGSVYQFSLANHDHGKYRNWSSTGSRLLQHCLPRKKLYITGKGGSCIAPITGAELRSVLAAAEFNPPKLSTRQLLEALGSWSPLVRGRAAKELGTREDNVVKDLLAMLEGPNRYARYGACLGLRYAGRGSEEAVDRLVEAIHRSGDLTLRFNAAMAMRLPRPQRGALPGKELGTEATRKAIPALLKQMATYEPDKDPMRKLHAVLAETMFYGGNAASYWGHFPNGKGSEKVDRTLLIPAIKSVLRNPNGRARSTVSGVFKYLTKDDLKQLWGDIYYATAYQAPSGSMFAGAVRGNGIALMAENHVTEGVEVGIDWVVRQQGWGNGGRKWMGFPALVPYGRALEKYFPAFEKLVDGNKDKKQAATWAKYVETMKSTPAPELTSIRSYIERTPDPLTDSGK